MKAGLRGATNLCEIRGQVMHTDVAGDDHTASQICVNMKISRPRPLGL